VDDPDAFYQPWTGNAALSRAQREIIETICAENNQHLFRLSHPGREQAGF